MTDPSKLYQQQNKHPSPENLDARILRVAEAQAELNAENNKGSGWSWMPGAATAAVLVVGITFVFNTNIFVSDNAESELFSESASDVLASDVEYSVIDPRIQDDFGNNEETASDAAMQLEEVVISASQVTEPYEDIADSASVVAARESPNLFDEDDFAGMASGITTADSRPDFLDAAPDAANRIENTDAIEVASLKREEIIPNPQASIQPQATNDEIQLDEIIVTGRKAEPTFSFRRVFANLFNREDMEPKLIDIHTQIPSLILDIQYAGPNNFVGEPIDGYETAKALLSTPAIEALAAAQIELRQQGLSLKIFDAYRPQRAVDHFLRWSQTVDESTKAIYYPNLEKPELFTSGYLAERSSHSRGSTVDLTIVRTNADGSYEELDMGTIFDFFDPTSWPDSTEVTETAQRNRQLLRNLMVKHGFEPFETEWWHFTLRNEPYTNQYFDLPVE